MSNSYLEKNPFYINLNTTALPIIGKSAHPNYFLFTLDYMMKDIHNRARTWKVQLTTRGIPYFLSVFSLSVRHLG